MTGSDPTAPSLGLDIGGTKVHGIVLDARSRVIAERVRPTEPGDAGVLASALTVAQECLRLAGLDAAHLSGVGVGIPGRVDHRTGVVHTAVNLGVERLELGRLLSDSLDGVGVAVDNDVKATALGAADYLRRPEADLTYLNFGTGVSAATLAGGTLIRGGGNLAGEIGHFPIDAAAGRCGCGQYGCIEVLAGGGQIARRLAELPIPVTLDGLLQAADRGNPEAGAEVERIATGIAAAVQLVVLAQGSTAVVLGGGVIRTAPGLVERARERLAEQASGSDFVASLDLPGRVTVLPAEHPLAAIGAALVGRGLPGRPMVAVA